MSLEFCVFQEGTTEARKASSWEYRWRIAMT